MAISFLLLSMWIFSSFPLENVLVKVRDSSPLGSIAPVGPLFTYRYRFESPASNPSGSTNNADGPPSNFRRNSDAFRDLPTPIADESAVLTILPQRRVCD